MIRLVVRPNQYQNKFTINAANTWEYKTITFPANPHNYPADNAGALVLHWWLSAGSTYNSTASTGQWTNFANGFRAIWM